MLRKSLTDVAIKDADQGLVEAVFATFDVIDLDGDVTRKGAIPDGTPVVISAYNHQSHKGALPIGKGTVHEVGNQAVLKGQFFMDTTHGRDAFATVKALSADGLQEWSYSLQDIESKRATVDGKSVREITRVKIKEVSPVLIGAGIDTHTVDVKDATTKFSELKAAALDGVASLVDTAVERLTLRTAEGKSISEQVSAYDEAIAALEPLRKAIDEHNATPPTKSSDEAFRHEFARFVALSQGAHNS